MPADLDNVVVYPNPYRSDVKALPQITFHNVPARATIRLYDLSGRLVRTLEKNSNVPYNAVN